MPLVLFDDNHPRLSPLTDLRASFDIRTGALTTLERLARALDEHPVALLVPEHLAAITRERHITPVNTLPPDLSAEILIVNGRCPLLDELLSTLGVGQSIVEAGSGDLVAACIDAADLPAFLASRKLPTCETITVAAPALLSRPWHVRTFRDKAIRFDLELLQDSPSQDLPPGALAIGDHPLIVDPHALVYPGVTFDLEHGPIVIAEEATIRPGAIIQGPAYLGPHSTVLDRTLIKGFTAIGQHCKVAGEVGGTIIQGFSNKAHDGHLGDSWLGEWVNLGAGTTNSNLLNTYGEVIAKSAPDASNERTGLQFLGCILGDHVKTAICTRIMTGAIVGTGTMWAATAPLAGCIPSFKWATDSGNKPYRFDKFMEVARAAMARRKIEPSGAYSDRLKVIESA